MRRWLDRLGIAAVLGVAVFTLPPLQLLVVLPLVLVWPSHPLDGQGTAHILVEGGAALQLLGLETEGATVLERGPALGWRLTAPPGPREVTLRFRRGDAEESFRFPVALVADSACRVTVRFEADAIQASACTGHHPGSYGGTWPH